MAFNSNCGRVVVALFILGGCGGDFDVSAAHAEIRAAVARGVEATRVQDIDAYMALIPEGVLVREASGRVVTRDQLKVQVLRDWSIIPKVLAIRVTIDSISVNGEEALVYSSQRWERLMLQRDGKTTDTVLTTQKHRERWRKTKSGWFAFEIEELGGEIFINGQPYRPDP